MLDHNNADFRFMFYNYGKFHISRRYLLILNEKFAFTNQILQTGEGTLQMLCNLLLTAQFDSGVGWEGQIHR